MIALVHISRERAFRSGDRTRIFFECRPGCSSEFFLPFLVEPARAKLLSEGSGIGSVHGQTERAQIVDALGVLSREVVALNERLLGDDPRYEGRDIGRIAAPQALADDEPVHVPHVAGQGGFFFTLVKFGPLVYGWGVF